MGKIPGRWLDYKPIGGCIPGTRFIAFKAPLSTAVNCQVSPTSRLDCESLIEKLPALGMVVDLTNTKRYYQPDELIYKGIIHHKIMVPGKQTPKSELVKEFVDCVNAFLQENRDNSKLIGVHCTHGVNRTGYFICKYMVTQMSIQPDEALSLFSSARGHAIERNNYVADIRRSRPQQPGACGWRNRGHPSKAEEPAAPPVTSWRHSFEHTSYDGHNGGMHHRPAHTGCVPPGGTPWQQPKLNQPPPYRIDANGWYVMGDNNGSGAINPNRRGNRNGNSNWRAQNHNGEDFRAHSKATLTAGDGQQHMWPPKRSNYPAPPAATPNEALSTAAAAGDQRIDYRNSGGGGGPVRSRGNGQRPHYEPYGGHARYGDRRNANDRQPPMPVHNRPSEQSTSYAAGLSNWRDEQLSRPGNGRSATTLRHQQRRGAGNRNYF